MTRSTRDPRQRQRQVLAERQALEDLRRLREPLQRELRLLLLDHQNRKKDPHSCCLRPTNQMRISPLEAKDIAQAFQEDPELRPHLKEVLARMEAELKGLQDNSDRQSFDCPLLSDKRCLVHRTAKPIGCLAWNPGRDYSNAALKAFAARDRLNDGVYGPDWKLRVIPLWLRRALPRLRWRRKRREEGRPSPPPHPQRRRRQGR